MAEKTAKKNDISRFALDFLMGGVSAAISKTIASPIEVIKLRLQNVDAMIKTGALDKPYAGIGDCAKRILADEGVKALWKGNGTNVIRYFPTQALNFSLKDYFKRLFGRNKERDGMDTSSGSLETSPPEVLPARSRFSSSTPWTTPGPGSPTI